MLALITAVSELIKAVAAFGWMVIGGYVVVRFAPDIARLIGRLKHAKISPKELDIELEELHEAVKQIKAPPERAEQVVVESATPPKALPPAPVEERLEGSLGFEGKLEAVLGDMTLKATGTVRDASNEAREVATEAGRSPKAALLLLSIDVERHLRELMAVKGVHGLARMPPNPLDFETLVAMAPIPPEMQHAALRFWSVRNRLIHGRDVSDDDVISAIDSGLMLLKALSAISREVHVIEHPGVPIYSDPEGKQLVDVGKALILSTTSPMPDGTTATHQRVYPTTRTDYEKGQLVAWEWNRGRRWGESWYRDPATGEMAYAWTGSLEFVGTPLGKVM